MICISVWVSSCQSQPKIRLCIGDVASGGFQCLDQKTGDNFFQSFDGVDNWISTPPEDFEALLNWIQTNCWKKKK